MVGDPTLPSWPLAFSCVSFPLSLHPISIYPLKDMVLSVDSLSIHLHSRHAPRPPATMYHAPHICGCGPVSSWIIIDLTLPPALLCHHSAISAVGLVTTRRGTLRHFSCHSPGSPHQALTRLHLYGQFLSIFYLDLWAGPLHPTHARSYITPHIPHVHHQRYQISACSIAIQAEPGRPLFTPASPRAHAQRLSPLFPPHAYIIHVLSRFASHLAQTATQLFSPQGFGRKLLLF